MAESSPVSTRRSSRISKRLKSTQSSDVSGSGAGGAAAHAEQTTGISGTAVRPTPSLGYTEHHSPIEDDRFLQIIFSFVGDFQYLFIGSVNRTFEKSYTSLFPLKATHFNASTIEHTKFCWDNIAACQKNDDEKKDKQRRKLWHSAARYGKIDVVKFLLEKLPPAQKDASFKNIRSDKDRKKIDWKYDLCCKAAKHGQMELLQWACEQNICVAKDDSMVCHNAIAHGHLDVFHWALKNGFVFNDENMAAFEASKNGQLEALKFLADNYEENCGIGGYRDESCGCCNSAAQKGQLEILKWLHEHHDTNCDGYTLNNAISSGHVESVKNLLENDCGQDDDACNIAASVGSLEILKLLASHDCERNDSVTDFAAAGGHLEIIEWANDNGCSSTETTCQYAAGFGQLDTLKWLRAKGCPWDEETTKYASTDEIYDWAKRNGCPVAKGKPREKLVHAHELCISDDSSVVDY